MADSPEQQDAAKGEAYLMGLFLPLMSNLASPIRAFYLGIGHATVASWALVALTAGGIGYLWVDLIDRLNMPITVARVANEEARLRETELRIVKAETELGQSAGELTWVLGELNWNTTALQAEMLFIPLPNATKLIMGWRRRGGAGGGMEVQAIPFTGEPLTLAFPFSGEWSSGDELILSFTQELSTGRRVRWVASGRVERMP
jgi:hypothetical protein